MSALTDFLTNTYGNPNPEATDIEVAAAVDAHEIDPTAHSGTYVATGVPVGTGVVATDTANLQAAITAGIASGNRTLTLSGTYKINASQLVGDRGVALVGQGEYRSTKIEFSGATSLFELGTDNGHAHDANDYDGAAAGFRLENLTLIMATASRLTALSNGLGNYASGTYAIRDWRGGDIVLRNVQIEGFDYPFWGIQSDVNRWDNVLVVNSHSGIYLGPRSDQFTATHLYSLYNDRLLDMDRVNGARFIACQFVDDGTDTINPIRIRSAWSVGSANISFEDCWFESFLAYPTAALQAFVEIGVGDSVTSTGVQFRNPTIFTNVSPTLPRTKYLVTMDRGDALLIENPGGTFWQNLDHLVEFTGTTSPSALVSARRVGGTVLDSINNGSGVPCYTRIDWGSGGAAGRYTFSGTLFGAQLNFAGSPQIMGADAATGVDLRLNSAAGQNRQVQVQSGGLDRWILRVNSTAEGGSNAGSDLELLSRVDAGTALATVLSIRRSDGQITLADAVNLVAGSTTGTKIGTATTQKLGFFNATPVVQQTGASDVLASLVTLGLRAASSNPPLSLGSGALTAGAASLAATTVTTLGTAGTVTLADGNNVAVGTSTGTQIGTSTSQKLGFFAATPIVQPTSTTDLRTLLINLGLLATGGASPLNLNGGTLTVGAGNISKSGATASLALSGDAGQTRDFSFQTAGSARWIWRTNSTAEGGSDAGSDFQLLSRTDAGASKTTVLTITRSTGLITLGGALQTLASATGSAGLRLPHGAAPSSPVNGDMWTTTAGLFVYINGVTKTVTLT